MSNGLIAVSNKEARVQIYFRDNSDEDGDFTQFLTVAQAEELLTKLPLGIKAAKEWLKLDLLKQREELDKQIKALS